jgi:hypothetical protein
MTFHSVSQGGRGSLLLLEWQAFGRLAWLCLPQDSHIHRGTAAGGRMPASLHSPISLGHSQSRAKGGRARTDTERPLHLLACGPGYCSQMGTVKPCQPQIHSESTTSAFLGCVAALASPSSALSSITCQVPSVSPRAQTLTPTYRLCTHALRLSKYLSWA